jgi:Cysteine-rich secretory protein family
MLGVRLARQVATVALVAAGLATLTGAATPAPAAALTPSENSIVSDLLSFANRERAARGLPSLSTDGYATSKAQQHAEAMRARGDVYHRGDFSATYSTYAAAGQNVGQTPGTSGELHRLWMGSSTHRRNILQPGFDAAGVGVACAGDGRMWVVVDYVAQSQTTGNRYSSAYPSSSPQSVKDGGNPCAEPTGSAATVGTPGTGGYWLAARDGGIFAFGDVPFLGSAGGLPLVQPVVAMTATSTRKGYWMVARDGGIFNYGDAKFYGSMGGRPLNAPMISIAARPITGGGYWTVASDGGIFNYNAPFLGSMGGKPLNRPIVAMAATKSGNGYWLVASDGGIFNYGDAKFLGSMGGKPLNAPIVAMAATPTGAGYWLIARDGGIFAYGDAKFYGSMGGKPLNAPIIAMARTPSGAGYWLIASDGGVFNFGNAAFRGSTGGVRINQPIVGAAA